MVSLATEVDRTIFFDFMPVIAYKIRDYLVRLQLYTVPGQVFYNATRKLVLNGVDGIIFVADSQTAMQDANGESLQNLQDNLQEIGIDPASLPLVLQYNKRDLQDIDPIPLMDEIYNPNALPAFATIATSGVGLMDALRTVSQAVIQKLQQQGLGAPERVDTASTRPAAESMAKSVAMAGKGSASPVQSQVSVGSTSFSASFAEIHEAKQPGTPSQPAPVSSKGPGMEPSPSLLPPPSLLPSLAAPSTQGLASSGRIPKEQLHAMAQEMGLITNEPTRPASPKVQTSEPYQGRVQLFPTPAPATAMALQEALFAGQFVQVLQQSAVLMDEMIEHGDALQMSQFLWKKGIPSSRWQRLQQHLALANTSPQLINQSHAMHALVLVLECAWG